MGLKLLRGLTATLGCIIALNSWGLSDDEFRLSFEAARAGKWQDVSDESAQHVLAPYIEYHRLKKALPKASPEDILTFASEYSDSPLSRWLVRHATLSYGAARRWEEVLTLNSSVPGNTQEQCIYYRAQLVRDQDLAFEGGRKLWLKGKSLPDQCDDLFKAMMARDEITPELTWERALLALQAGNRSLSDYLLRKLKGDDWQAAAEFLRQARRKPDTLLKIPEKVSALVSADDIIYSVMSYLIPRKTDKAAALGEELFASETLSDAQKYKLKRRLGQRSYRFEGDERPALIDNILTELGDADMIGPVLREAIAASDWQGVLTWTSRIQGPAKDSGYHQYWRARALEQTGDETNAQFAYKLASLERDFYGFLAAEKLALPYTLNNAEPDVREDMLEEAVESRAIERIQALWNIGEAGLAAEEWNYLLLRERSQTAVYAELAMQRGWPSLAVQATITGQHWNYLDYRFPLAYQDEFTHWANEYGLDPILLMAIARRESAFNPHAKSPVGARGLMQMMPATARQVAKEKDVAFSDTDELLDYQVNIPLASYYVRSLVDKYQGNLIAALAGYNAGPNKVDRWLEDAPVTYDQFIESIPYRETRDYVKAILAYRVIFNSLRGQEVSAVLLPDERAFARQITQAELQGSAQN